MAEPEAASAAPGEKRHAGRPRKTTPEPAGPAPLAKAAESGDPAVQKLLADRWTAQQNASGNVAAAVASDVSATATDAHVAALNAQLAALGFE